jgi:hypothetical protein
MLGHGDPPFRIRKQNKKARRPLGAPGSKVAELDCQASQAQGSALLLALLSLLLEAALVVCLLVGHGS